MSFRFVFGGKACYKDEQNKIVYCITHQLQKKGGAFQCIELQKGYHAHTVQTYKIQEEDLSFVMAS